MTARRRAPLVLASVSALALGVSGCGGFGGSEASDPSDPSSINVIMVNNPQMIDLQQLTDQVFEKETGIEVNFTVLPENDVRDRINQEFASQAGVYDVASISNYEVPFYADNGWLTPLDPYIAADETYDFDDIFDPIAEGLTVDDEVYALPFYGESSFLMYRKDVFAELGLIMPENPTWPEVAELAATIDEARPDMAGICLRGLPGWGQVFAPLTTVVNTFGGTWWDEDWNAQVDAEPFVDATQFYVDLVREHGEPGAAQAGFTECLTSMSQGGAAMWYDATSAAGTLESESSPVAGKIGYAPAPVLKTESAGWLYSWAWGIQAASQRKDAAWEFISWASSKGYENLVGERIGWPSVPAGKRASTYQNEQYLQTAGAFAEATQRAIESAQPQSPGVQPRPAPGIQFVAIPQFAHVATQVSEDVSSAIAGQMTVQEALGRGQQTAETVENYYQSN